ncbi:PqiC family protein [Pectobacterium fontis]|uniref:Lipoprotein n=1 Tax=Pectobacterium fontis TaxID=2558042 RepID=A0A7V8L6H9_9GAMM|nr:PqiC family protein [Pectobacterium fontis]KHN54618.1 lipoprotein [Pectobacterium fontis]
MKRVALCCQLAALMLLSACSSSPIRYHTLLAPASSSASLAPTTGATYPAPFFIDVLPVGVPAQIDTPQLVIRQGESGAVVLDNERWLSPLSEEIRTALSADLSQRLNTQDISGLVRSAETPVVRIHLQVRRFDSWPGRLVMLDADWSLSTTGEDARARLVCRSQITEQETGSDGAMLHAQQQVITRLAEHIATTAIRWMPDRSGTCFTPPPRP